MKTEQGGCGAIGSSPIIDNETLVPKQNVLCKDNGHVEEIVLIKLIMLYSCFIYGASTL